MIRVNLILESNDFTIKSLVSCIKQNIAMAFKKRRNVTETTDSPADLFKTLTQRKFPDVMPHQKEMLSNYGKTMVEKSNVALQLPTGSGKTLVGLLIGEWRRRKYGEHIVYLCPTKQLVNQTVHQSKEQYGIEVAGLIGSKTNFPTSDKADYTTGQKIAITTYSSLFNTSPFFESPDTIIIDDAHVAENYIASLWSLEIRRNEQSHRALHDALSGLLKDYISTHDYARLIGEWKGLSDVTWVDKLSSPFVKEINSEITTILDTYTEKHKEFKFSWSLLREHIDSCQIYIGGRSILIRPLIPPTWTHSPFANAKQRIFMSATLGKGGDLERLTGQDGIERLPAPEEFQSIGVGRRFFIFPELSLRSEECDELLLKLQEKASRSVVLTPNSSSAEELASRLEDDTDFKVFQAEDIESNKAEFIKARQAVAILANRYDGIDFPNEECRLLCLKNLPRTMNAQEQFLMSKFGASALFNERIKTRVLQAVGRCTRALQDRSAVFVTGQGFVDYLADQRNWENFDPELQAELAFGVEQSKNVSVEDIVENFEMFLTNKQEWADANEEILNEAKERTQSSYIALDTLANVVSHEIRYQKALWSKDYNQALTEAKNVLGGLSDSELRGYRALWHYLAGSAAIYLSKENSDQYACIAQEQFNSAQKAAPQITWLAEIARRNISIANNKVEVDTEKQIQAEELEKRFRSFGTVTNHAFEKKVKKILDGLVNPKAFEEAQRQLGELLGFQVGNEESDGAPDPWWMGETRVIVFEDNVNAKETTALNVTKARQASSHPNWISNYVSTSNDLEIKPILVTPSQKVKKGAHVHLGELFIWPYEEFCQWAKNAIIVLRDLKTTMPPQSDLEWRATASERLENEGLTLKKIVSNLDLASEVMEIVE